MIERPDLKLAFVCCASLVGALACKGPGTTTAPADGGPRSGDPGQSQGPGAIAEPAPGSSDAGAPRFWVANGGLHAYDLDGNQVASLTDLGAMARRAPDGRVAILVEDEGRGLTQLSVVSAAGQVQGPVPLPNSADTSTCTVDPPSTGDDDDGDGWALTTQSAMDFRLNPSGTHACVTLLDRNENMADLSITVAVELGSGAIASGINYDIEGNCEDTGGEGLGVCTEWAKHEPWFENAEPPPSLDPNAYAIAIDGETETLTRAGAPVPSLCRPADDAREFDPYMDCASIEATSTTGRWLLISGELSEGDYIHRSIYLFDRETEVMAMIACHDSACQLEPASPTLLFGDVVDEAFDAVGESEIEALPGDRFWLDGYLVIPEQDRVVHIGGTLARTLNSI